MATVDEGCPYCEESPCTCAPELPTSPPDRPLSALDVLTWAQRNAGTSQARYDERGIVHEAKPWLWPAEVVQALAAALDQLARVRARLAVVEARASLGGTAEALAGYGARLSLLEPPVEVGGEWVAEVEVHDEIGQRVVRRRDPDPERAIWAAIGDLALAQDRRVSPVERRLIDLLEEDG